MADVKKPEAPRPAALAVKSSAAVAAKTSAVPARVGALPVKTAVPAAKPAGVPAKTAAVPVRTAAVPSKTTTAPVKPGLAGKAGAAVATDVASKTLIKPDAAKTVIAESKAPADTANGDAESQNFEEMRTKFKPAKKNVAIPTELLGNAKSYDDKLILVKILTEKEQSRVVLMVKNMLRSTNDAKKK